MVGTNLDKRKPRTVMLVGHHATPNDQLVWPLVEAFRPGAIRDGDYKAMTREEEKLLVERWTDWPEGFRNARFYYPRPSQRTPPPGWGVTEIVVGRAAGKYRTGKKAFEIPLFEKEKGSWYEVVAGGERIDSWSPFEMTWLLQKVLLTLPIYKPDFAFADLRENVFEKLGADPRRRAWPLMILGGDLIERLGGRDKLLEAPASRADELEGKRIMLQVSENPFVAQPRELAALAQYLGLDQ